MHACVLVCVCAMMAYAWCTPASSNGSLEFWPLVCAIKEASQCRATLQGLMFLLGQQLPVARTLPSNFNASRATMMPEVGSCCAVLLHDRHVYMCLCTGPCTLNKALDALKAYLDQRGTNVKLLGKVSRDGTEHWQHI